MRGMFHVLDIGLHSRACRESDVATTRKIQDVSLAGLNALLFSFLKGLIIHVD